MTMNTFKSVFFAFALFAMGAISLPAEADIRYYQPRELIQVSNDDISMAYNQTQASVTIEAKSAYELYCRSSWLKATQEGNTINITATENDGFVPRTAKIILTTKKENVSRVINITQKPEPGHDNHYMLPSQGNIYPMTKMDLSKATHDPFIEKVLVNRAIDNPTIKIKSNTYETGICTHALSTFKIKLNGAMHFVADFGIDDAILSRDSHNHGDALYKILLDGKEVASGRLLITDKQAAHVDVNTHGAKVMEIIFDPNGSTWGDHIDMGNPYFELTADKPELID